MKNELAFGPGCTGRFDCECKEHAAIRGPGCTGRFDCECKEHAAIRKFVQRQIKIRQTCAAFESWWLENSRLSFSAATRQFKPKGWKRSAA